MPTTQHAYNGSYAGDYLSQIAFPLGGIGAGMICVEGNGGLSHVSLRHRPEVYHEPLMFAAVHIAGAGARVLEGPVPQRKVFGLPEAGNGEGGKSWGLPRFREAAFTARFPFAEIGVKDAALPIRAELTAWSPFVPNDADASSLPVVGLEYRLVNRSTKPVKGVFSFHASNVMADKSKTGTAIRPLEGGFAMTQASLADKPEAEGHFAVLTDAAAAVDCAWFRGSWFDPLTMIWNAIEAGKCITQPPHAEGDPGRGGSLYVRFNLKPKAERTIRVLLAWYVPRSKLRHGKTLAAAGAANDAAACCPDGACGSETPEEFHTPWYAGRFGSIDEVAEFWRKEYDALRDQTKRFTDCFYNTTLPPEAVEAVAANLSILKSPTCLRQKDGRFWAFEGCGDTWGCCSGTCTHVWNYAQALPHLFPALERSIRETEYCVSQNEQGHQNFRASLPIRAPDHDFHAAVDGQLGGIVKTYRDWRISGDTAWLGCLWPRVKSSLEFSVRTWDPDQTGIITEPHHNTYDIEFWGPDAMATSFYLAALDAAIAMGRAVGADVAAYEALLAKGQKVLEKTLWNGEYFFQKVQWRNLHAGDPLSSATLQTSYSPEARVLLAKEGPKYQYGKGCLSDGMLGDWLARCSGMPGPVDSQKVAKHLASVFKYNFRSDLSAHANPQRPTFALNQDAGLLLCSWPKGGKPQLPFVYSDEVWTGIEFQVASHLIMTGQVKEGLTIVRGVCDRYDGRWRNPFDEYECGHWYARAMSSYALLQALAGARYDAVEKVLYLQPKINGDFKAFLCTASGYGTVGVKKGKPFFQVESGTIEVARIEFTR